MKGYSITFHKGGRATFLGSGKRNLIPDAEFKEDRTFSIIGKGKAISSISRNAEGGLLACGRVGKKIIEMVEDTID